MYFDEMRAKFAEDHREVIDGVVVAYLQDHDEIEWTWAILNDAEQVCISLQVWQDGKCDGVGCIIDMATRLACRICGTCLWPNRPRDLGEVGKPM